jgi:3-deoxy-D-manno-octulosonate 8-phosphate phosphatase (KDO 8-P phosphatase)
MKADSGVLGDRAEELERLACAVRWLLLDVDGVLTDGRLYYGPQGEELKVFDVKDGYAIQQARRRGLGVAVLSARAGAGTALRLRELGVERVQLGVADKGAAFTVLLDELRIDAAVVAAIGDDLPDLAILARCALAFAPADAAAEVRAAATVTLSRPGGRGAVREMIETILRARGEWP